MKGPAILVSNHVNYWHPIWIYVIIDRPMQPIHSNLLRLEEGEKLYLVSRPHLLYRERQYPKLRIFGFGRAFLTDR